MIVKSCTLKIRGGTERDSYGKKARKGALIQWEKSATLGVSQDQYLFVWTDTLPTTKQTDLQGGGIAFAIVGDHENRPTDMTNLIVEEKDEDSNRKKVW